MTITLKKEEVKSFVELHNCFLNPQYANHNKIHILFSSAEVFKKPLWQTV